MRKVYAVCGWSPPTASDVLPGGAGGTCGEGWAAGGTSKEEPLAGFRGRGGGHLREGLAVGRHLDEVAAGRVRRGGRVGPVEADRRARERRGGQAGRGGGGAVGRRGQAVDDNAGGRADVDLAVGDRRDG